MLVGSQSIGDEIDPGTDRVNSKIKEDAAGLLGEGHKEG
jgi:hypothetical protein